MSNLLESKVWPPGTPASPSAHRDQSVKLRKYAEAGIPHYWCIDEEDGVPVAHVYELDHPTRAYAPAGIFRGALQRPLPFELDVDLAVLLPPRRTRNPGPGSP